LEDQLVNKKNTELTEFSGATKLEEFRRQQEHNVGLSFHTISSIGPNSAVIHYSPTAEKCEKLNADLIYLLDSGGQYLDGTTDVTRTVHYTKPKNQEKDAYTRVLLGNLDLEKLIWP